MKFALRLAKEEDLKSLAAIYTGLYRDSALGEEWTPETAYQLLRFFYSAHPDIFVVAEEGQKVVGAIMSLVKPWHDGNRLVETEVFVDTQYQQNGIGTALFCEHFRLAIEKYDAKVIEAHTYEESDGRPLNWYKKQGYEVVDDWFVINGDIRALYDYLVN